MFITVGENVYELSTKLGVSHKIEQAFKVPMMQLFGQLRQAEVSELAQIVSIAAGKISDKKFQKELYDEWDYTDLFIAVQELIVRLLFSGTPEQIEAKLAKFPVGEHEKNAMRELLGLPIRILTPPTS